MSGADRPNVIVVARGAGLVDAADALAARLGLPRAATETPETALRLEVSEDGLALALPGPSAPRPVRVDFKALLPRVRSGGREVLVQALRGKRRRTEELVDATAGLGVDAFIAASRGMHVRMIERHPIVHALLADGLARAQEDAATQRIAARLELEKGEGRDVLARLADGERVIDAVYLDPMFPSTHGKNSALPQRTMQALRRLCDEHEAEGLLRLACACARRVVVKRPRTAEWLEGRKPTLSIRERSCRFDVYLTPH